MSLAAHIRSGLRRGVIRDAVNRDGPSGWYVPTTAAEFTTLGLATPDYLFPCQDASSSLVATIGSLSLTTLGSTHLYRQTVNGWGRYFVGFPDDTTANQRWSTTSAALDLAEGQSFAMLAMASITPSSGTRNFLSWDVAGTGLNFTSNGYMQAQSAGVNGTAGTVNQGPITTVRQFCVYRNGATNVSGAVSDTDAVTTTHSEIAMAGKVKTLRGGSASCVWRCCYLAIFLGTNAEQNWASYLATLRGGA